MLVQSQGSEHREIVNWKRDGALPESEAEINSVPAVGEANKNIYDLLDLLWDACCREGMLVIQGNFQWTIARPSQPFVE
jgi:uncharacterized protein YggU (UPF0235/DUF167 family)